MGQRVLSVENGIPKLEHFQSQAMEYSRVA